MAFETDNCSPVPSEGTEGGLLVHDVNTKASTITEIIFFIQSPLSIHRSVLTDLPLVKIFPEYFRKFNITARI
jgi:hypothetical protein